MTHTFFETENGREQLVCFNGAAAQLAGTLHLPKSPSSDTGVLIVVGGPQTRTGSHRQFILLARFLASKGVPVLRYDYQGMGDSEGEKTEFLEATQDLPYALDLLCKEANVGKVAVWGLCDAVSLLLMYLSCTQDQRIIRIIAANPWVRQANTEAQAYLKNYYLNKLLDKRFWLKMIKLEVNIFSSLGDFIRKFLRAFSPGRSVTFSPEKGVPEFTVSNYVSCMLSGLRNFQGDFHLIISGKDLTAEEFLILINSNSDWAEALARVERSRLTIEDATHTFSSGAWREKVEKFTLNSLFS